jgi:hypothetical protein
MGLDCYWELPTNEVVTFDPELSLVGGILSGHGGGSFRGKVYSTFVMDRTDISLYQNLDPEQVETIATALSETEWDEAFAEEYRNPRTREEFVDLVRMFQAYAQAGARMRAWY